MAKIKKKGTSGQAKNFITRTQAVRKLQISLPDFRKLCIFKGIYPREPRNKKKASKSSTPSTTFYYTKDIQYLLHEPLLAKFRDHKAFEKKLAKALGRNELTDAARLEKRHKPRVSLDHIIKERYPTFIDALRDLDDALSMLFLFANLPSTSTVPPKTISLCEKLCLEFQHYLIITHSLRKSFLSIKGIYYQAEIQGQDIFWLVPYKFAQRVTSDVDFRIMGTFVEFYTTLLGFVNFRLYTSIGLVYPPKFDKSSDDKGGELGAFVLEERGITTTESALLTNGNESEVPQSSTASTQRKVTEQNMSELIDSVASKQIEDQRDTLEGTIEPSAPDEEPSEALDTFDNPISGDADILPQPDFASTKGSSTLFSDFTFFLGRETPRQPIEFLLRAFGCKRIGWDTVLGDGAFTNDENDLAITHQVVDRPQMPTPNVEDDEAVSEDPKVTSRPAMRVPGRIYIQPQWIWDCINEGTICRPDQYAPGAELPPHLSPWVKPTKGQYDPSTPLEEQEREGEGAEAEEAELDDDSQEEDASEDEDRKAPANGEASETENDEELERGMKISRGESSNEDEDLASEDSFQGFDNEEGAESEDDAELERLQHQRELEAEAAGKIYVEPLSKTGTKGKGQQSKGPLKTKAEKKRKQEEEELERQKMMMSRKKRKILEKMLYSNRKKDQEAELLRSKRRKLEKGRVA